MKTKKLFSVISLLILIFPSVVLAQWDVNNLSKFQLPGTPIYEIISRIMLWLLAIVGIVCVIGFIIAGFLYFTAAGDEDQANRAKRAMMYSVIGIVVALSGLVMINFAVNLLKGESF
jgi:hypothetical protein